MELGVEAQALWLLIIAAAVAMFTKYIRLPYTIALVVVGIVMGALDLLPQMLPLRNWSSTFFCLSSSSKRHSTSTFWI